MLVTETFHGFIESTQDVLLIFEGCRRGLLPRICRRLQEKERKMIQSGSVFVFDERESGIKRWTDGRVWSPSRILGNFLIYRELDKRAPGEKRHSSSTATSAAAAGDMRQRSYSADHGGANGGVSTGVDRGRERQLVGSLSDSYKFRKDGLIKKTMSIVVNGVAQHLISYYHPNDVLQGSLRTPSSVPELASLEISPELLLKQNFRIPPMVEPTLEQQQQHHHHHHITGGDPIGMGPLTPPDSFGDRRMHQLRSMSVGSSQFMYPYRMDPDPKYTSPMPMYGTGYAPISSPTSMASSPSTPMLSPGRQSIHHHHHHQRHYSTSSFPRNYAPTADIMPLAQNNGFFAPTSTSTSTSTSSVDANGSGSCSQHQQQPTHPHIKTERPLEAPVQSNANLGQLLNPVHPLHSESTPQPLFSTSQSYPNYSATDRTDELKPTSVTTTDPTPTATSSSTPISTASATPTNTSPTHPSGGGSIDFDGYMYYHNRQQPLNNSQHVHPDLYPRTFMNPFYPTQLAGGDVVDNDLADTNGPLMLK
ncbi:hypothetical protein LRAMOSA00825 [Lichtheimia ramosa]|uniref:Gti1/Pac2 family protein n=1 Tax=Lichtheimia ramosa TaxID=688394 RepID=A0A077WB91_9FUNG|nr:hypothetical protein LRAMOSA00825 [Lichtheimia ramosa]